MPKRPPTPWFLFRGGPRDGRRELCSGAEVVTIYEPSPNQGMRIPHEYRATSDKEKVPDTRGIPTMTRVMRYVGQKPEEPVPPPPPPYSVAGWTLPIPPRPQ